MLYIAHRCLLNALEVCEQGRLEVRREAGSPAHVMIMGIRNGGGAVGELCQEAEGLAEVVRAAAATSPLLRSQAEAATAAQGWLREVRQTTLLQHEEAARDHPAPPPPPPAAGMQLLRCSDQDSVAESSAALVLSYLDHTPDAVICVAAGSTPTKLYRLLAMAQREHPQRFARVRIVQLDEWNGLGPEQEGSCSAYITHHVLRPWGIDPHRSLAFNGVARDPEAECGRVALALARWGGIDVSILGLGLNGHLGFNEPRKERGKEPGNEPTTDPAAGGSPLPSFSSMSPSGLLRSVHVAELTPSSQGHSMIAATGLALTTGLTLGLFHAI